MKSINYILLGLPLFLLFSLPTAQAQKDWTVPFGPELVFVENQGQYDALHPGPGESPVQYVVDHGFGWQVLFGPRGATYLLRKTEPFQGEEHVFRKQHVEVSAIGQLWEGLDPAMRIVPQGLRPDYFTYAYEHGDGYRNLDHVPAFTELVYQNAYPGIDIRYACVAAGGIKYTLHLAPQADLSNAIVRYTGGQPSLDVNGHIHLPTVLGDLVDHAPVAWYADGAQEPIGCRFKVEDDLVGLVLDAYDPNRPVVVDPWTINPALPAPFNRAFEVDADNAGNVYVFGGGMGYNLKKYNSAGTLQWTHVSPWDTSNAWFGELLTTGAGDCFITSGSAAKLRRLSTAGATSFTNNGPFFNLDEYWTLIQNCDNSQLISGGTRIVGLVSPQGFLFNLNMANGNQVAGSPYNISPVGMKEIRALCRGAGGMFYALSNDNLIAINSNFTIAYSVSHGFTYPYNSPAYKAVNVQGANAIDANATAIYTNHGSTVERRNVANGAVLGTVAVPGGGYSGGFFGTGATNSGIVLDDCGNLYVGSTNQVLKYSSALAQLGTVATAGAIYDVVIAPGGVVIWGGNGLVTSNTSLAPCAPRVVTCTVLNVELSYFTGECRDGKAHLAWATGQESGHVQFQVEHSPNGQFWETMGTRAGTGTGSAYTFDVDAPAAGWFYRLRYEDAQGQTHYSTVVSLPDCGEARQVIGWPSRTPGEYRIAFESAQPATVLLQVFDVAGNQVIRKEIQATTGMNTHRLQLAELPAGLYIVKLAAIAGGDWDATLKVVRE